MALSKIKAVSTKPSGRIAQLRRDRKRKRTQFTHEVQRRIVQPRNGKRVVATDDTVVPVSEPRHIQATEKPKALSVVRKDPRVPGMVGAVAGVATAVAVQRFGRGSMLTRRIDLADFAIMALSMRKTARLLQPQVNDTDALPPAGQALRSPNLGNQFGVAAAGVLHGIAFATVPTVARWFGAGMGAAAISDTVDDIFAIANKRSGPIEIIERRITASPVKRFP